MSERPIGDLYCIYCKKAPHTEININNVINYKCENCGNLMYAEKPLNASDIAKRTSIKERYDLIPPTVLKAIAEVFGNGAEKYGDRNWQKSRLSGDKSAINHALRHIINYQTKIPDDESEDLKTHLSHAIVNLIFEYWYEENKK